MYIGIAGNLAPDKSLVELGFSIHDATYSIDFSIKHLHFPNNEVDGGLIATYVIDTIKDFSKGPYPTPYPHRSLLIFSPEHIVKFVGGGITSRLVEMSPHLCGRLWRELDIVPLVFHVRSTQRLGPGRLTAKVDAQGFPITPTGPLTPQPGESQNVIPTSSSHPNLLAVAAGTVKEEAVVPVRPADEQADSAVRKAVLHFGPSGHNPRLSIGFRSVQPGSCSLPIH